MENKSEDRDKEDKFKRALESSRGNIQKQENNFRAESLKKITPAQCFIDGKAMTVAFFPEIKKVEKGAENIPLSYNLRKKKNTSQSSHFNRTRILIFKKPKL